MLCNRTELLINFDFATQNRYANLLFPDQCSNSYLPPSHTGAMFYATNGKPFIVPLPLHLDKGRGGDGGSGRGGGVEGVEVHVPLAEKLPNTFTFNY